MSVIVTLPSQSVGCLLCGLGLFVVSHTDRDCENNKTQITVGRKMMTEIVSKRKFCNSLHPVCNLGGKDRAEKVSKAFMAKLEASHLIHVNCVH